MTTPTTPLFILVCENDEKPWLGAGLSIEGSQQDGMTTIERTAEVIVRAAHSADRVVEVWCVDFASRTNQDVTREVAEHVQARLGPYLRNERDRYRLPIAFVQTALGVTLDGDRWIPDAVAGDWTRPYGAESQRVAA